MSLQPRKFTTMHISQGISYMMLSTFFVALLGLRIKLLAHIPAMEILFFNTLMALIASIMALQYHRISIWGKQRSLLVIRGLLGSLSTLLHFVTLQHISLASAIMLHYTAPIFASLMGIWLLQETVSSRQWLYVILSFMGVVLINGPSHTDASWYILVGLTGACLRGLGANVVRTIAQQEHPLVIAFYAYLVAVPLTSIGVLHSFVVPQNRDILMLGVISALNYAAHYYAVKAYQLGPLAPVSATSYVAIVYALLFSYLFLDESLPAIKLLGVGLVLMGVMLSLFYRKHKTT